MVELEDGKVTVSLTEHIRGEKLKRFIDFCFQISDSMSLASFESKEMLKVEVKQAIEAFGEYFRKKGDSEAQIKQALDERYKDVERQAYMYAQTQEEIGEFIKTNFEGYSLLKREVTLMTHCTWGRNTVVYHLQNSEQLKEKLGEMATNYSSVVMNEEENWLLEDPAFYKDGKLVCSICSHECMGSLSLTEEEYKVFRNLRIPHDICDWKKVISEEMQNQPIVVQGVAYYPLAAERIRPNLEEDTKPFTKERELLNNKKLGQKLKTDLVEYAYQEREELTIWGYGQKEIPKEIGLIKTLRKLKIFDNTVKRLPKVMETLTNLTGLRITGNKVEELGFDIGKLNKLEVVDFSEMPLKEFPKSICELEKLHTLYLDGEAFIEVPEEIMGLKELKVVSISGIEGLKLSDALRKFLDERKPKEFGGFDL